MHIVSAADDAFVPHFCAMLHSAWLYHPDARYTLLAHEIADETLDRLRGFAGERSIALEIVEVGQRFTFALPTGGNSAATYCRLFIADVLPESVERAIYLDADITLNGRLDGMFATDMQGKPLAAVRDLDWVSAQERRAHKLGDDSIYFNAGVLLMDLAMWRRERIGQQVVDFATTTNEALTFMDQSAINVALAGRIQPLERNLNLMSFKSFEGVSDPIVIHYAGPEKPWQAVSSPFYELYRFHHGQTPWPFDEPVPAKPAASRGLRGILAGIGIGRPLATPQESTARADVRTRVAAPALERARSLLAARPAAG